MPSARRSARRRRPPPAGALRCAVPTARCRPAPASPRHVRERLLAGLVQRAGGGDPLAYRLRLAAEPCTSSPAGSGPGAREDQRERHGAVEQVRAARLAGALGGPGDVQHVVQHLERHAEALAEPARVPPASSGRPPNIAPSRQAASNRLRGLQPAALEVALGRHVLAPGVGALHQLPARERRRGPRERAHRLRRCRSPPARRTRARRGGRPWRWPRHARRGEHRRPAAAQLGARRARRRARASPCAAAQPPRRRHEPRRPRRRQRRGTRASAAAACRRRRACRRRVAERLAVALGDLRQPLLGALEQRGAAPCRRPRAPRRAAPAPCSSPPCPRGSR